MAKLLKFLLIGLLLILLVAGASLLNARPWRNSILELTNFKKITPGMNRVEVEQVLGGPPGDYGFNRDGPTSEVALSWDLPAGAYIAEWYNDQLKFQVAFDQQGRVVDKRQAAAFHRSPSKLSWRYWWNCYIK